MALGLSRCGYAGALAAWVGFTLPSAVVLIVFALGIASDRSAIAPGVLHGLKVVAGRGGPGQGMARRLCSDTARITLMARRPPARCCWLPAAWGQVGVIAGAAVLGLWLFPP